MSKGESGKNLKDRSWMRAIFPANAGITGFSTMLPLYILQLGGTVVEVSLLSSLYNFVLIPASIFWGTMTDRFSRRRIFFLISYAGLFGTFLAMYFFRDILTLTALYGMLAFVIVANSAASNLLIMEVRTSSSWPPL